MNSLFKTLIIGIFVMVSFNHDLYSMNMSMIKPASRQLFCSPRNSQTNGFMDTIDFGATIENRCSGFTCASGYTQTYDKCLLTSGAVTVKCNPITASSKTICNTTGVSYHSSTPTFGFCTWCSSDFTETYSCPSDIVSTSFTTTAGVYVTSTGALGSYANYSTIKSLCEKTNIFTNHSVTKWGWKNIVYGNGKFLAVGYDGSSIGKVAISSDKGANWTVTSVGSIAFTDVTFGNGMFVATTSSGQIVRSYDGTSWYSSANAASFGVTFYKPIYCNGKFIAKSSSSPYQVVYSTDGSNWTQSASSFDSNAWVNGICGGGVFIAYSGTNIYRSTDGATWTTNAFSGWHPSTFVSKSIAYGGGRFIILGDVLSSKNATTSTDGGITWTDISTGYDKSWTRMAYGNGMFIATANGGAGLFGTYYSYDGLTWGSLSGGSSYTSKYITYGNGVFIQYYEDTYVSSSTMTMTSYPE